MHIVMFLPASEFVLSPEKRSLRASRSISILRSSTGAYSQACSCVVTSGPSSWGLWKQKATLSHGSVDRGPPRQTHPTVTKFELQKTVPQCHWAVWSCVGCRFCYRPSDLFDICGVSIVYPPSGGAASRKRPRGHQKRISFRGRWDPDGVRVLGFVRLNT